MKKLYFTLLSTIISVGISNAQTLTQANHAPVVGDNYATRQVDSSGIGPGASGAGAVWTFTNLAIRTATTTYTVGTVASTGSTSSYPSASVAVSGNNVSFYSSTSADLKYWGGTIKIATNDITLQYSTPAIYAKYPMSLSTSSNSAISGSLTTIIGSGTFTGNCNVIADGTGTLALPAATYSNCIRVTTTQTINFVIPAFVPDGKVLQTTYDYYSSGTKYPLFSINTSSFSATVLSMPQSATQTLVTIATTPQTSIKENQKEVAGLKLFPNPAKNTLSVSFTNDNAELASVEIVNTLGQLVKKDNLGNVKGQHNIDLKNIQPGMYIVVVYVGNAVSVQRITVE